jgi:hypothetical protein
VAHDHDEVASQCHLGCREATTQRRRHPEHLEYTRRHEGAWQPFRLVAAGEVERGRVDGREVLEESALRLPLEKRAR